MDYDQWIRTTADIHFYDIDYNNSKKLIWRTEKMARQPAQKLFQEFFIKYHNRNFSNPKDYIHIPPGGDRELDPQEEFIRRNMLGDINK